MDNGSYFAFLLVLPCVPSIRVYIQNGGCQDSHEPCVFEPAVIAVLSSYHELEEHERARGCGAGLRMVC